MSTTEELPTFDVTQKKKKKSSSSKDGEEKKERKSKKVVSEEPEVEEKEKEKKKKKKSSSSSSSSTADSEDATPAEGEVIDFGKKKKKKSSSSKSTSSETTVESENTEDASAQDDSTSTTSTSQSDKQPVTETEDINEEVSGTPWVGSDRDYKYSELTYRIYHLLQANNPELISDQKRAMKTPKVFKEGSRKTVWANFAEICQILNRKTDHVLSYVFAELGTNGSVDGNQNLVIKGRFQQQQIEVVIRHYIAEYVACRNCKSPNTTLDRNNRLYFLCCNVCNSKRSVAVIKKGLEGVGKKQPKDN